MLIYKEMYSLGVGSHFHVTRILNFSGYNSSSVYSIEKPDFLRDM
jgi:hypothetical protein